MSDLISKSDAIDAINKCAIFWEEYGDDMSKEEIAQRIIKGVKNTIIEILRELPSAQPDGIHLEWIDKHLEWLDNCDNDFAQLAKVSIKAMVELWKKDRI